MKTRLKAIDPKAAEPSKPKILIYGKPGVGKTWTALDFPNVYYIDTEGGADLSHYTDKLKASGGVYFGIEQGSLDFDEVIGQVQALATEEHHYKTLVIDSFTKLYLTAAADAAEKGGDDFGRDKKEANKPTRRLISWLTKLDMNVILIAHEKPLWGLDSKGNRSEIGTTFDGFDKMEYELHLCLNILKQGASRKALVKKSRLQGFPDASVFPWSYEEFASRYGKDVIERQGDSISLATPEQIEEMKRLLGLVKLPDGTLDKWLKAAKSESIEELTGQQIAGCIESLKQKIISPTA